MGKISQKASVVLKDLWVEYRYCTRKELLVILDNSRYVGLQDVMSY